jgi:hypothetical protein
MATSLLLSLVTSKIHYNPFFTPYSTVATKSSVSEMLLPASAESGLLPSQTFTAILASATGNSPIVWNTTLVAIGLLKSKVI